MADIVVRVKAFAQDPAVLYDNCSDHRTGTGESDALTGQFKTAADVIGVGHAAKSESTKSSGENSTRSSIFSPTPTNRIGIFNSFAIAVTTPPLAVPSSFVRTRPVTPALFVNSFAWINPF